MPFERSSSKPYLRNDNFTIKTSPHPQNVFSKAERTMGDLSEAKSTSFDLEYQSETSFVDYIAFNKALARLCILSLESEQVLSFWYGGLTVSSIPGLLAKYAIFLHSIIP